MKLAVIGGGPAGLRAAESAAALLGPAGSITLFEGKPSVGRKFLVAGKGGLNLTKNEASELFHTRIAAPEAPAELWEELIGEYTPEMLRAWAAGLGVETFVASTGRVYPKSLKAAPLLRRWVARLKENGVAFAMHHHWSAWERLPSKSGNGSENGSGRYRLTFNTPEGVRERDVDAVICALGGGSWPQTGSDGGWRTFFSDTASVALAPCAPANCGWEVAWDEPFLTAHEGQPLKNIVVSVGDTECAGELLITRYGLEGGALYQLGPQLRAMEQPLLSIDLKPGNTLEQLVKRCGAVPKKLPADFLLQAAQRWKLGPVATALLQRSFGCGSPLPATATVATVAALAAVVKALPLPLLRPRPLDEAISTAGGIRWSELDSSLMLRHHPGVFVAGEMIDWEAPTGGYLLQGAFATGHRAGTAAARYLLDPRA